ncbi:hypothetical protein NI389_09815 [Pseudoalteromonas xiamenensis]|uniref:hypothetical protein n=1 Tax=Pseudoalteromonas xiamenensis TaxID=882626 RepID=UPI0027E48BDD|nr:hypothetical protein [Pseudoalteromonas xiamenensis]WMN58556.1 hypothetical protein NI389_09815 [Pseudoalteromonas xiamenensis]
MFAAHGEWRILIVDSIVFIQPIGAFNREGVLEFQYDVTNQVMAVPAGRLTRVVTDLQFFELSTADSQSVVQEYFEGVKQRGYERIDYIGANALSRQLLEGLWKGAQMTVVFHDSLEAFLACCPECQKQEMWLAGND